MRVPQNALFIMKYPMKIRDLGLPVFRKPPNRESNKQVVLGFVTCEALGVAIMIEVSEMQKTRKNNGFCEGDSGPRVETPADIPELRLMS